MATLYEIDSNIRAFLDGLYDTVDENGEVAEVDIKQLEELQAARETKLENIALYIKNLDAEAAAIAAEENNLATRRKRVERKANGLRGLLIRSMIANGDKNLSSPKYSAKIRESEATEITDASILPKKFIRRIKPEIQFKPDKNAIKEALKAGKKVKGARLVTNRTVKIE